MLETHMYRFIKAKKTSISQEINLVGKLEKDDGEAMFFIAEKQQKAILHFFLDSLIVTE